MEQIFIDIIYFYFKIIKTAKMAWRMFKNIWVVGRGC